MEQYVPELESRRVKIGLAFAAYQADQVRLTARDLTGYTHLLASRQGLYAVNEQGHLLVAYGFFFGITVRGNDLFVFESCDLPRGPTFRGRILRLTLRAGVIVDSAVLAKGLDNGCHQIDFFGDRLHVTDTYNQRLLRFAPGEQTYETLHPLPPRPAEGWLEGVDPAYRHVNSLLTVGDRNLLLLHNGASHTGRQSEIAVFDHDWRELERWPVDGTGCHGLALLEDGTLLTCGSMEGNLISQTGLKIPIGRLMTRGLSVGVDTIAVGSSELAERDGRMRNRGTVTFLDRDFRIRSVIDVPGAPMEIRRIDGQDAGLSGFLAQQTWGSAILPQGS